MPWVWTRARWVGAAQAMWRLAGGWRACHEPRCPLPCPGPPLPQTPPPTSPSCWAAATLRTCTGARTAWSLRQSRWAPGLQGGAATGGPWPVGAAGHLGRWRAPAASLAPPPPTRASPTPRWRQVIKEASLVDRESLLREVAILKSCRWRGCRAVGQLRQRRRRLRAGTPGRRRQRRLSSRHPALPCGTAPPAGASTWCPFWAPCSARR